MACQSPKPSARPGCPRLTMTAGASNTTGLGERSDRSCARRLNSSKRRAARIATIRASRPGNSPTNNKAAATRAADVSGSLCPRLARVGQRSSFTSRPRSFSANRTYARGVMFASAARRSNCMCPTALKSARRAPRRRRRCASSSRDTVASAPPERRVRHEIRKNGN